MKQSDYDMSTAAYMFDGGRYFYAVFMCHLSLEKALKGLCYEMLKEAPPKTHNLISLINKIGITLPEEEGKFVVKINSASIVTRYPEDLDEIKKQYTKPVVEDMLKKGKEVVKWIKAQL
jgi:HEPN domain-containing protein